MRRLVLGALLLFGVIATPAQAVVAANGVISGAGTEWTLTIGNTGDTTIQCMRFTAANGVTVTRANGPGTVQQQPNGFASQGINLAPGGNVVFSFGTAAPYPDNGGGTLFVSDTCATGSDVSAPVSGPAPPPPAAPQPVLGRTEVVHPVRGTSRVRLKGSKTFTPVTADTAIPDGSEIDTAKSTLRLVVATPGGGTETADISEGRAIVHQDTRRSPPVTQLTLSEPLTGCPGAARAAARKKKGPTSRKIVISTKGGHFESVGRYASAIASGTTWRTTDTCTATLVQAIEGTVRVTDLKRKTTTSLRAPARRRIAARRPR